MAAHPLASFSDRLPAESQPSRRLSKALPPADIEQRILSLQATVESHVAQAARRGKTKRQLFETETYDLSLFPEESSNRAA